MTEEAEPRMIYTHQTTIVTGRMRDAVDVLMKCIDEVGQDNKCHVQTKALEGRIHEIKISVFMPENPDEQNTDNISLEQFEED